MIATVISLVATALLALLLISTTLHSGSTADTSISKAPGVAEADHVAAQQSLSTALTAAGTAAASAGGYGSLDLSALAASDPSVSFVSGPTTDASTVSMALEGGGGSQGTAGAAGGAVGAAISGAEAAAAGAGDTGGASGGSVPGGSVTFAARSSDGICWLVWRGDGSATWYGAQTHLASCTAPPLPSAPATAPVSASAIGWQEGGFPTP
jgi:hypothetical protein